MNNELPKISIVTASYNQGDFLEECIDSVLSQNYPNLEYIVMDGGSSDNSVEIIKKHEKYLTYWQSKPDGGQYAAIQEGFGKTTGEIMAWLNSDDKYHHHAFYKVAYLFTANENIEWLTGRHSWWDKDGNIEDIDTGPLPAYSRAKFVGKEYDKPWIQQESTFWRRSLWVKAGGGLRTNLKYAGDLELWTRFFRHTRLYTVDTLLGGYRRHGDQKAALSMDKYIDEAEKVLEEETILFQNCDKDLLPAPDPVIVSFQGVTSYMDSAFSPSQHKIYKLSDNSDLVINYLINKLTETEGDRRSKLDEINLLRSKELDCAVKIEALQKSLSWRMTEPVRRILDLFKR